MNSDASKDYEIAVPTERPRLTGTWAQYRKVLKQEPLLPDAHQCNYECTWDEKGAHHF